MCHCVHTFDFPKVTAFDVWEWNSSAPALFQHSSKLNARQPWCLMFTTRCIKCGVGWILLSKVSMEANYIQSYMFCLLLVKKTTKRITHSHWSALDKMNPLTSSLLLLQEQFLESEKQKPRRRCRFSRWDYGVSPQKKVPLRQSCSLQ